MGETDDNDLSSLNADWCQVRRTVVMLQAAVTHIQLTMTESDESINDLASSFTLLANKTNAIKGLIEKLPDGPQKDELAAEVAGLNDNVHGNVIAFQFYDKLNQRIEHIRNGLDMLAELLNNKNRIFSQQEWMVLQNQIKDDFHIDDDKVLFDAIINGASREEALRLYHERKQQGNSAGDIDLF
ncbi:MAG: hypothetical protein GXP22_06135 [Gammaproteobacteria bacterium]|nr:hypothetical protein [Gammaproteobacteria bacterium]